MCMGNKVVTKSPIRICFSCCRSKLFETEACWWNQTQRTDSAGYWCHIQIVPYPAGSLSQTQNNKKPFAWTWKLIKPSVEIRNQWKEHKKVLLIMLAQLLYLQGSDYQGKFSYNQAILISKTYLGKKEGS